MGKKESGVYLLGTEEFPNSIKTLLLKYPLVGLIGCRCVNLERLETDFLA